MALFVRQCFALSHLRGARAPSPASVWRPAKRFCGEDEWSLLWVGSAVQGGGWEISGEAPETVCGALALPAKEPLAD